MRARLVAVALAVAAVAAAGGRVGGEAARMRAGMWPEARLEGWMARFLSARRVMADLRWLDILQYAGDSGYYVDGGKALVELSTRLTDLDPHFVRAYVFAGSLLYWQCGRPVEAAALIRKGIGANPAEAKLKMYLAAFTFSRLDALKGEIRYLEEFADDPDSPPIVRRILAHTYARAGDFRSAAGVARFVLDMTTDPAEKRWAQSAMRRYAARIKPGSK